MNTSKQTPRPCEYTYIGLLRGSVQFPSAPAARTIPFRRPKATPPVLSVFFVDQLTYELVQYFFNRIRRLAKSQASLFARECNHSDEDHSLGKTTLEATSIQAYLARAVCSVLGNSKGLVFMSTIPYFLAPRPRCRQGDECQNKRLTYCGMILREYCEPLLGR